MSGMITRARAFSAKALQVVNNVAKQQYTVGIKGVDAVLAYDKSGNNITFIHTEVPKEFQGKGVGKLLAQYAFDEAIQNKLNVTCKCHFLAKFYENNRMKYKTLNVKMELD
ncbi:hypothetical protein K1T71_005686 [Dendrolimus kikuchii]|uniref:Uncharacterized protein n=1 Tax=Dendrolimus kikuchii TaxID=765133 RepID=A0ACC1D525_9NEOP|nr:hypothetical protein K1T71_005686 [Dendrolimus kikuchii]